MGYQEGAGGAGSNCRLTEFFCHRTREAVKVLWFVGPRNDATAENCTDAVAVGWVQVCIEVDERSAGLLAPLEDPKAVCLPNEEDITGIFEELVRQKMASNHNI